MLLPLPTKLDSTDELKFFDLSLIGEVML